MTTPRTRRKARFDAIQILYQWDVNREMTANAAMEAFRTYFSEIPDQIDPFTQRLVMGVASEIKVIDERVTQISQHWKTERMSVVDRNILRLGVYEICFCEDVPATVSINEMVELSKQFGTENSPAFINGILDKIRITFPLVGKAQ